MSFSNAMIGGLHLIQVALLILSGVFTSQTEAGTPAATVLLPQIQSKPEMIMGRISAIAEDKIILSVATEQKSFGVTAKTEITLDGQATKLAQLPIGSPATITADGMGEKLTAVSIHVMTLK